MWLITQFNWQATHVPDHFSDGRLVENFQVEHFISLEAAKHKVVYFLMNEFFVSDYIVIWLNSQDYACLWQRQEIIVKFNFLCIYTNKKNILLI